ncbi:MAG: ATP12 family chaperone protein [Ferrovibrio sp.]|jgi:chaperone required for assembly of F1-ATPase|uniref:ATP12 family chaperone protein n=1 Tax=Ferrovibrio sp. TaxID=1917215 RepID=UPI00391B9965
MKRIYKTAAAQMLPDGTAVVLLDGRRLKTPAKSDFVLPNQDLAEAVAAEWAAQGDEVRPLEMPLTRLCATAIDRVRATPEHAAEEVVRYGDTDLLSYRAEEPAELAARQEKEWQPMLDWFRERYDVQLNVTSGIMAVAQPAELRARLERACSALDPFRLTALHAATAATGSIVLGLALLEGSIDAATAHRLGLLDELFQAERWGEDEEASIRRTSLLEDLQSIQRFLVLLDSSR